MITFVSSNKEKQHFAAIELTKHNIPYEFVDLTLVEIQSDDPRIVVEAKAKHAYEMLRKPAVVSDHFWQFPALNGFPGAYMKYINEWLTPEQLLRLLDGVSDRQAFLTESLAIFDGTSTHIFKEIVTGLARVTPEGNGLPGQQVISLAADGHSIAYHLNHNTDPRGDDERDVWKQLVKWYRTSEK